LNTIQTRWVLIDMLEKVKGRTKDLEDREMLTQVAQNLRGEMDGLHELVPFNEHRWVPEDKYDRLVIVLGLLLIIPRYQFDSDADAGTIVLLAEELCPFKMGRSSDGRDD